MKASIKEYLLNFRFDAGTSRGVMKTRKTWFVILTDEGTTGIGECAPLPGLSIESVEEINEYLRHLLSAFKSVCDIHEYLLSPEVKNWPSIRFALETAVLDLQTGGNARLFDTPFLQGQPIGINGLIWMGNIEFMKEQLKSKIELGFRCIKIKIGAIALEAEYDLLDYIRKEYGGDIEIRLDANGAFTPEDAPEILAHLSKYKIHSIEQPIRAGQPEVMSALIQGSPIPVALDEELIPVIDTKERVSLLDQLRPHYIILKPSLLGGFKGTQEWIELAKEREIGWWVTSALESNVGLNAIAQFTSQFDLHRPQGLGTGGLYHNNIPSPLVISGDELRYDGNTSWDVKDLLN